MRITLFVNAAHMVAAVAFQFNINNSKCNRIPTKGYALSSSMRQREEDDEEMTSCGLHQNEAMSFDRRGYLRQLSSDIFRWSSVCATFLLSGTSSASVTNNIDGWKDQQEQQRMGFNKRPKAPTASLIPATQQRLLLEKCLLLSERLLNNAQQEGSITSKASKTIAELQSILIDPKTQNNVDDTVNPYYTPNLTYKKRIERDQKVLSQYYTNSNRTQLSGGVILAAMNTYTDNLKYSREYKVQDAKWKKSYIRSNGGLPEVEKLVRADMDLRVMYRNQVQLKVDDAAAELYYYTSITNNRKIANRDDEELFREFVIEFQQLLTSASIALNQWFDMIDDIDTKEAISALSEVIDE